ncbi:asparagine synthase [Lutibacter sp. B2]|nr:asparagine synthase [Lutibacter sp. B2]
MRDGLVPTALGTVVTAGAAALRARDMRKTGMRKKNIVPMLETAVLGFGLAHVVLGTIDLIQHRE